MKNIVLSNCWSFKNKGDAAIVYGTINLFEKTIDEFNISALAFDYDSFNDNKEKFSNNVQFLPMPSLVKPFNILCRLLYALNYIKNDLINEISGILFIYTQILTFKVFRRPNKLLDNILKTIEECDIFVAVGGNYLWSHSGLYIHLVPIIYAKMLNKPVILLGHSIGPFKFKYINSWIKKTFITFNDIIVREELSKKYLEDYAGLKNVIVAADMAFLIKEKIEEKKVGDQINNKSIGITVRKYLFDDPKKFTNYIICMSKIIEYYLKSNYEVYIFPFSYASGKEQDLDLSQYIHNSLNKKIRDRLNIINIENYSAYEIIDLFYKLNLNIFIGTRLHSTILASIANIPSITISYQHYKAFGISKQLNMEKYIIKIEEVSYNELKNMSVDLIYNLDKKKLDIYNSINTLNKITIEKTGKVIKQYI